MQLKVVSLFLGGIFAIFIYWTIGVLFDLSPTCWSGWKSPSIGKQGACSHHGGVNKSAERAAFFVSVAAGLLISVLHYFLAKFFLLRSGSIGAETGAEISEEADMKRRSQGDYCPALRIVYRMSVVGRVFWNLQMRTLKFLSILKYIKMYPEAFFAATLFFYFILLRLWV